MHLLDINVWLGLAFKRHKHHASAIAWFNSIGQTRCCFCRLTQMGFLRLASNPQAMGTAAIRERDAYWRLRDHDVTDIEGFTVPALIDHHDTLQVVEMTIVFPPCILDFAKSYVDRPPDYPVEALSDWEAETAEDFGEKWPQVQSILGWLRTYGIHYFDAKPGNIRFQEGDE